ncbi:MAG TPA: uracil phosphoribosyltransferase [Euzebyales bacterium]|nr:uracil phosphoribosyltransferase [Euzebyales bacterium]
MTGEQSTGGGTATADVPDGRLRVVDHPLAGHLLAGLRDESTPPERFRYLTERLATVLVLEATRSLPTRTTTVRTPLADAEVDTLHGNVIAVPILRAGLGLLTAVTGLLPDVQVGYIGLERDEETLQPSSYYLKVPPLDDRPVLLLDPMLATGGSASFAAKLLRERGATNLTLVCVVAAPEGVSRLTGDHPDLRIVTAGLDERLNDIGYIVPGLGDFGDRLFGTFGEA